MQLPLSPSPSKGWRDVGSVWRLFALKLEGEKKPEDGQPLYSREKGEASAAASFPSYPFRLSPPPPKASSTQTPKGGERLFRGRLEAGRGRRGKEGGKSFGSGNIRGGEEKEEKGGEKKPMPWKVAEKQRFFQLCHTILGEELRPRAGPSNSI